MPDRHVVLLRDPAWPEVPGVCCWRDGLAEAVRAAGGRTDEIDWAGSAPLPADAVVVAETLDLAQVVIDAGVPGRQVFALVLPAEPMLVGVPSAYGDRVAGLAGRVGGLLTDSEWARESVEQAATADRPWVWVYPPLATDRSCPRCAGAGPAGPTRTGWPAEVAQLVTWRELIAGGRPAVRYSFHAARLRGLAGPFAPGRRGGWGGVAEPPPSTPAETAPQWTAAAQAAAAAAVLARTSPPRRRGRGARRTLVAGYNLKFVAELAGHLDRQPELDVTLDEWPRQSVPTDHSEERLAAAESIFAEWVRPSTLWLAERKRPDQFLVARLHRYELASPHPANLKIDNVDAVVYVGPHYGRRIRDELGWPEEKLVYLPNYLDVDWFDRPKLPEARFGLGLVGMDSDRKRFDLALDLLAAVRREDRRFTLFVRSAMPWHNQQHWRDEAEREFYGHCWQRLREDPLLRGAVVFDPPGRDMARWYRQVGHVLSTSDDESFHLAPAEGMASGAVPVIRPWPGAADLYELDWVHTSVDAAAAAVLGNADPTAWATQSARAKAQVRRDYDPASVLAAWTDLLHGDLPAARAHIPHRS